MAEELDGLYPYDVMINGHGYVLARQIEPNLPFRTQRAKYGYTPTFIERQNVSGQFGDSQQDFWLTSSQNDWSLGEDQRYFDPNDAEKSRRYWLGSGVISTATAGEVTCQGSSSTVAVGSAVTCVYGGPMGLFETSATHLFNEAIDRGAHGLAGSPLCMVSDENWLYISDGTTIRTFNGVSTFAAYSATGAQSMLYMNNSLYGVKNGVLSTYASTGTATASFTWKDAKGGTLAFTDMQLAALGGKVIILMPTSGSGSAELWQWDGTGASILATFPPNFMATDMTVVAGTVFVVGYEIQASSLARTAVWFYQGSNIGRTFIDPDTSSSGLFPGIAAFRDGFLFSDKYRQGIRYYDLSTGGVETWAPAPVTIDGTASLLAATSLEFCYAKSGDTNVYIYNNTSGRLTGTVQSSLYDFNSSLPKLMRGVTVTFDNSSGGTVDIAYAVDGVTSYTSLQTGAVSGTEYTLPAATTGHAISVKVTLNPSGSNSPKLQRVYVRAAPVLTQYRTGEYILDLSGRDGKTPTMLRNGQPDPLTGPQQLTQLISDVSGSTPITIVDRLGSYTGVAELDQLEVIELKPEEYWVRLITRGV